MTDEPVAIFDGHNDTLLELELAARRGQSPDFAGDLPATHLDLPRAREGGFAGGFFAMFTPGEIAGPDRPQADDWSLAPVAQEGAFAFTVALFERMRALAAALPDDLAVCTSAAEIRAAMAAGRIAMLPHIEGAEAVDPALEALETLHGLGLRSLGLVWSRPNAFGHGAPMAPQDPPEPGTGLSDAGRALVRACNGLGIVVDLSHLTEAGFWDAAAISDKPLVATHSNAHALSPSARNLTDRQLDAIAETGGVVGLNYHVSYLRADCAEDPDTPLETCLSHLDHLIGRLGEDGVALGSDFDGCTLPRAIGDVTGQARLVAAMRDAGYGEALIAKICRENWLGLLERSGL